jgi:outer membrane receptor protein involved in Fe transport
MGLVGLKWSAERYAAEAFTRFAGAQTRLSADDRVDPRIQPGGTLPWTTLNLRGHWHALGGLRLALGLENVLDRNYREHGSGINAPGRNLIAGLDWGF